MDTATPAKTYYLYPGNLFVPMRPHRVSTILGSCVSVCLWDPATRFGGINHYLLPLWNGEGLPTPRYGNIAISTLVEKMLGLGCRRGSLMAKIFGGASMWKGSEGLMAVGERNVSLAVNLLEELRIPMVCSDVGGDFGRKILFDTGTGQVLLRRNPGNLEKSGHPANMKKLNTSRF